MQARAAGRQMQEHASYSRFVTTAGRMSLGSRAKSWIIQQAYQN